MEILDSLNNPYHYQLSPEELFEYRVQRLLWILTSKEKAVLTRPPRSLRPYPDFFIPQGLAVLGTQKISTYVEASINYTPPKLKALDDSLKKFCRHYALFFVFPGKNYKKYLKFHCLPSYIHFLSFSELCHFACSKGDITRANQVGYSGLRNRFSWSFCDENTFSLKESEKIVRGLSKNRKLAIVLGTGISLELGADSWNKLVSDMMGCLNPKFVHNASTICDKLGNSPYSESLFAKLILTKVKNQDTYYNLLRSCVYGNFAGSFPKTSTLYSTAVFVKKHAPLVLSFNYDDFLERQMAIVHCPMKECWRKTDMAKEPFDYSKIYHVHGFLPNKERLSRKLEESIVLNEDEYFNFYESKLVDPRREMLIRVIQEKNCLFVGTSLSDIFFHGLLKKYSGAGFSHFAMINGKGLNKKEKGYLWRFFQCIHTYTMFYDSFESIKKALRRL
jgi:hypothetical protein